jgi:oligoendopeptidase F
LLAQCQESLSSSRKTFSALDNSDFVFPEVTDSKNEKHSLTHGTYGVYLKSKDRVLRENAFKTYHGKYKEFENTLSETLNGELQKNTFLSKTRNYKSNLEVKIIFNKQKGSTFFQKHRHKSLYKFNRYSKKQRFNFT